MVSGCREWSSRYRRTDRGLVVRRSQCGGKFGENRGMKALHFRRGEPLTDTRQGGCAGNPWHNLSSLARAKASLGKKGESLSFSDKREGVRNLSWHR